MHFSNTARRINNTWATTAARTITNTKPQVTQMKTNSVSTQDSFVRSQPPAGGDPNVGPRTALQKHVDFFDYNGDGKIDFTETYRGLRELGFGHLSSGAFATVINLGLGRSTGGGIVTVDTQNIHKGKHPGDSDAFDDDGRHVKENAQIVKEYDTNGDDRLSYDELWKMIKSKNDGAGGIAAASGEWLLLNYLAGENSPQTGEKSIDQATIEQFYDGSLFYEVAERAAAKRAARDQTVLGRVGGFFSEII